MRTLSVKSPLDIDFYKYSMAYFVWKHFGDAIVKYKFKNRTKGMPLAHLEKTVAYELGLIQKQYRYTEDELFYISNIKAPGTDRNAFPSEFINFLATVQLPDINVFVADNDLQIETEGPWKNSIWWETMALSAVNFICYKDLAQLSVKDYKAIGEERLMGKIAKLRQHPRILFSEFGTRRRLSFEWQRFIVETLERELPEQLYGTSNVLLAKELGIRPVGTQAHELFMIGSRLFGDLDEDILGSHGKILDMWYETLGPEFSTALTDTFGTEFFFRDFGKERAEKWKGMRQDSGHPDVFARAQKGFYEKHGLTPEMIKSKFFIPSDGLKTDLILSLDEQFGDTMTMVPGWGTDLTNDVGFKPLSIVMKAVSVNGKGTVKLSDNIAKATGTPEDIERYKRIFNYTNVDTQELIY
jgi:nicotinate phosphoribosyltransferase